MSDTKDEWWVSRGGHQFGPVPFDQVIEAAKAGRLEPRTDMLFGGGLTTWVPAGEVDGVFEKIGAPAEDPDAQTAKKSSKKKEGEKAAAAKASGEMLSDSGEFDFQKGGSEHLTLPGANRLAWILGTTVLPAALSAGIAVAIPELVGLLGKDLAPLASLLFLVPVIVPLVVTVKRFQNLAMSGWWTLLLVVPLLNLWLYFRLFACPPGYGFSKKLDTIGKVLAGLYGLLVVAIIGLIALGVTTGALSGVTNGSGFVQKLKNQAEEIENAAEKIPRPGAETPAEGDE